MMLENNTRTDSEDKIKDTPFQDPSSSEENDKDLH
jgi:hypothetical protein